MSRSKSDEKLSEDSRDGGCISDEDLDLFNICIISRREDESDIGNNNKDDCVSDGGGNGMYSGIGIGIGIMVFAVIVLFLLLVVRRTGVDGIRRDSVSIWLVLKKKWKLVTDWQH